VRQHRAQPDAWQLSIMTAGRGSMQARHVRAACTPAERGPDRHCLARAGTTCQAGTRTTGAPALARARPPALLPFA
jgi:hypothetical protein